MNEHPSNDLQARVERMRAWQEFETEDFYASDLEAVLTAAEAYASMIEPKEQS